MVNPFFHPYMGGTEKYLWDLCTRLAKRNDVSVITSQLQGTRRREHLQGIGVHRLPAMVFRKLPAFLPPPYSFSPSFPAALGRICREEKTEILHLHNRFCLDYNTMALTRAGMPLFLSLHNARPAGISPAVDFFGGLYDDLVGNIVMRSADRIIANSRWTLDATIPKDCAEKSQVIYNGIDTKAYKRVKADVRGKFDCDSLSLTVCRLLPQKGLEYLVRALPLVKSDHKAAVIGSGPDKDKLERLARRLGVADRLVFTGFVPEEKMTAYYSAADFFVLPSLWEPFGMVLTEAMACGAPVVSTRTGGIPEVVGDAGLLVQKGNAKQLAAAMERMAGDSRLRQKFSKAGRKRAEKYFEWDIIARQFERSYREFLNQNQP
jgi:glycosyltransferase involved in cell wall biosynthesis